MSYTYEQLRDAISAYELGNDEQLFLDQIPAFIRLAEDRIFKGVRLNIFSRTETVPLVPGQADIATPADFYAPYVLTIEDGDGVTSELEQKDPGFLRMFWPDRTETDRPRFYAQKDQDTFLLAPTPDEAYSLHVRYLAPPASLTDGADDGTTWLSENAPNAMLYGALMEAATFLKEPEGQLTLYNSRFREALERLKNLGEGQQTTDNFSSGQIRMQRT